VRLTNKHFDSLYINNSGTENMSMFLYSLIRFTKPNKILELGTGYSTIFLAHALKDIQTQFNLNYKNPNHPFFLNPEKWKTQYHPILYSLDNLSDSDNISNIKFVKDFLKKNNLASFVKLINRDFWDFYNSSSKDFDFIWVDGGLVKDYYDIMEKIFPKINPGGIILFHNTLSSVKGKLFETIIKLQQKENKIQDLEIISFVEPHKKFQNCFTICKKSY